MWWILQQPALHNHRISSLSNERGRGKKEGLDLQAAGCFYVIIYL